MIYRRKYSGSIQALMLGLILVVTRSLRKWQKTLQQTCGYNLSLLSGINRLCPALLSLSPGAQDLMAISMSLIAWFV